MGPVRAALAALALVHGAVAARADVVELRGSAAPVEGTVTAAGPAGVEVRSRRNGLEQVQVFAWSEVRDVRGTGLPVEAERWRAAGDELWRARIRVERDDWAFALEPLRRAFAAWEGSPPCADALRAAAGLAEACRRAGFAGESVRPGFEAIRLLRAAPEGDRAALTASLAPQPPLADALARVADLRLPVPAAPCPLALGTEDADRALRDLAAYGAAGDAGLAAVAAAYRAAVEGKGGGEPASAARLDAGERAAVVALEALAESRAGAPQRRAAALVSLARARRPLPAWFEPWARLAAGMAMARDADGLLRDRGLVLLASLQVPGACPDPGIAACAARESALRAPARPAEAADDGGSMAAALAARPGRPDAAVPRERSDATAAWLEARGDARLLAAHLEAQLEVEPDGPGRTVLVDRLARIMASQLEREDDPGRRDALMARAMSVVRRFEEGADPLRLVIMRAQHRAAQRTAEDRRAGRARDAEAEAARQQLDSLVRDLQSLAARADRARDLSSRDASVQVGLAAEALLSRAALEEESARNARFFRAWAAYYAAWIARDLGHPDWRGRADDALRWFADLIEPGRAAIDPADVSVDLRGNEGFASAILGSALAASLVQTDATADAWLALLDSPRTHGSVRLKLPAWRMASLLDRGDLARAVALLRAEGDGPQGVPMALIAAARAGRTPDAPGAADLLTEAVGRLVAAGRLRDLSAMPLVTSSDASGPGGRLFAAVRAAAEANRLREAGRPAEAMAGWKQAAEELDALSGASMPPALAAGVRGLRGFVLRGAGRPAEAAEAFLEAAKDVQGERSADARWMAALCLEEASRGPGGAGASARQAAVVDAIVADLPKSSAAVRARAWRATRAAMPSVEDIDALLGDDVAPELAPAARRAALDALYRRFRALQGEERRAAARRALAAGDDAAAGGSDEGTLELRRRLEMAIALDDRARADDALDALDSRGARVAFGAELAARRAQRAALDGRLEDALEQHAGIEDGSPWAAVAAQSLMEAAMRTAACPPRVRAAVARAALAGRGTPGAAEAAMWMRAEAEILREGGAPLDMPGARAAGDAALLASPRSTALLLAHADLRTAAGDVAGAAEPIRAVLSSHQAGSEPWLEAKALQVEGAESDDPRKARSILDQARVLAGGFGGGPAGLRLAAIDARLPAPSREPDR